MKSNFLSTILIAGLLIVGLPVSLQANTLSDADNRPNSFFDRHRAECTATKMYLGFIGGRRFVATASGRNYQHAKHRACERALDLCERNRSYLPGSCLIVNH